MIRPRGPGGGRIPAGGGGGRAPRQPSSIGPSCAPPAPPRAASLAATSVVVMVGDVCAISGEKTASFAVDIDLWRSSQKRYQMACETRSANAKRAGKEGLADVLVVAEPSSRLAGARDGNSRTRGRWSEKSPNFSSCCSRRLQDGVHGCTLTSAERDHDGVNGQFARLSICDENVWCGMCVQ